VRKTLADCKLTPDSKRKLAELSERPDSEIDFSDTPLSQRSFGEMPFGIPFTGSENGSSLSWQTRLNQVLRKAMLDDIKKSA
jgi:hypothetical protein